MKTKTAVCIISLSVAIAATISGMLAHQHSAAGMYRQMPGIIVGLLCGFGLDSPIPVFIGTATANAYFYYVLLNALVQLWRRKIQPQSS